MTTKFSLINEIQKLLESKIYSELPLDVCMNLNFNGDCHHSKSIHQKQAPPKFCTPWGAANVNKNISVKEYVI